MNLVNYTVTRPYLIIKNLVTDHYIIVTENYNITHFGNQGHSRGTVLFSTIVLR